MAISNYSELQSAITDWLARSSLTTAQTANFIQLAESMFKRPPLPRNVGNMGGIRGNKTRLTGSLTAGTNSLTIPSDFQELNALTLTADPSEVLVYVSDSQLRQYRRSGTGKPRYYGITDIIEFDVSPDDSYAYEISYFPGVSALSNTNTTNWLLTKFPDVYLSAAMFWANRYLMAEDEAALWANQYKEAAALASAEYLRGHQSQGPISIQLQRA
jgi:hypothetical protein